MRRMRYGVVVLMVAVWVSVAAGMWMRPGYIPTERLIANATAYIAEEPNDAGGYYTLARIHYLAFVNKAFLVGAFNEQVPPSVIQYWWQEDYLGGARYGEAMRIALEEFGIPSTAELTDANRMAFYQRVRAIEGALEEKGRRLQFIGVPLSIREVSTHKALKGRSFLAVPIYLLFIRQNPNHRLRRYLRE